MQLSKVRQIQRDAADSWLRTCLRYVASNKHSTATSKAIKNTDPTGKQLDPINLFQPHRIKSLK